VIRLEAKPAPAAALVERATPLDQALEALEFSHGAILDAISCEDGLDAGAGEKVLHLIRAALTANGHPPPDWPKEDEVPPSLPIWTASSAVAVRATAPAPLDELREIVVRFQRGTKVRGNDRREVEAIQSTLRVLLYEIDRLRSGPSGREPDQEPGT